jgi:hypothetical protein
MSNVLVVVQTSAAATRGTAHAPGSAAERA